MHDNPSVDYEIHQFLKVEENRNRKYQSAFYVQEVSIIPWNFSSGVCMGKGKHSYLVIAMVRDTLVGSTQWRLKALGLQQSAWGVDIAGNQRMKFKGSGQS